MAGSWLRTAVNAFSGKKYRKSKNAPELSQEHRRALGAGLINSEQIMAFADSLETGLPKERIDYGLRTAWSISSREEALETLAWLETRGDRWIFDRVFAVYEEHPGGDRALKLAHALWETGAYGAESDMAEDLEKGSEMLICVEETYRTLEDPINGRYRAEHYREGILAWDLGRHVTLARMCCDHGLIDAAERDRILALVGERLTTQFSSWPSFARSYVLGRAARGGAGIMFDGIRGIAKDAMSDKRSPWQLYPL